VLELPSDPDIRRRVKVLDTVFAPGDRNGPSSYSGGGMPIQRAVPVRPMLVALSSASIGTDVLPTAGAQRSFQLTVIEVPVKLEIAAGPFTLSPALLRPAVTLDSGASLNMSGGYSSGGPSAVLLDLRGAASYTFHPDLPANARVDQLVVTTQQAGPAAVSQPGAPQPALRQTGTPGPSTDGTFSIYNWLTAAWQPLAAGNTQVAINPPTGLLAPDGTVRVQVTSGGADRTVRFVPPELTVLGVSGP